MPSALPDGEPAPADGSLPESALAGRSPVPFGVYVHVPFCSVRCGYCDFNTYTAAELTQGGSQRAYVDAVRREVELAATVLAPGGRRPVSTVFFGGGTPTLLPAGLLAEMLAAISQAFGLAPGAEVTTEANPDSVTPQSLAALRAAGVNRLSLGMQSAVPHVLATLDRTHDPDRVPQAVRWARSAGFEQLSLDLIYGTPGESLADWRASLSAALAMRPDHVSAYALIVEEGTALARRIRRGEIPAPDDDDQADKYELADELLTATGLGWYELSNWAVDEAARCRHNLLYWTGGDWWGFGPGAHSHVGGVRWWNVKHPAAYSARLLDEPMRSPAHGREVLDPAARREERLLLESRLVDGMPVSVLDAAGRRAADEVAGDGLADPTALAGGRLVLTRRGRLLADAVTLRLLGA